jgi:hypothetical protein
MTFGAVTLNVDYRRSRGACSGEKSSDSAQDMFLEFSRHQFHEPDLNINNEQHRTALHRGSADGFHGTILN